MSKRMRIAVITGLIGSWAGTACAGSCADERGAAAQKLVYECREVSPATHPPCNASNSCDLIESEIRRGCQLIGTDGAPPYCANYAD
jgi:hypothetical protein